MNRIQEYQDNFIGLEESDDIMIALMEVLDKKSWTPEVGWRGLNFHWGKMRNYTFEEVQSQLYEIYSEEVDSARALGYGKFRINR
jgi:hypothetical protein